MYAEALEQEAFRHRNVGQKLVFAVCAQMDGQRVALQRVARACEDRSRRRVGLDKDAVEVAVVKACQRLGRVLDGKLQPPEAVARLQLGGHLAEQGLGDVNAGGQAQRDRARFAVNSRVLDGKRLYLGADRLGRLISKKQVKKVYLRHCVLLLPPGRAGTCV